MKLYEATTLAEFVRLLKEEHGDSYATLGDKVGVSGSTLHRIAQGGTADDKTLDMLVEYANVPRTWVYEMAKGIKTRAQYSRITMLIASLVEQMPPDMQDAFLAQAKAVVDTRKRKEDESRRELKKVTSS